MTGPEHYQMAEQLLAYAHTAADNGRPDRAAYNTAVAHVHATLAVADATITAGWAHMDPVDQHAWRATAGTAPQPAEPLSAQ